MKYLAMAALILLAGCTPSRRGPDNAVGVGGINGDIIRSGPDEYGVVCYEFNRGYNALSCVKVK